MVEVAAKFTGDTAQLERAYQKLRTEQHKLKLEMAEIAETAEVHHRKNHNFLVEHAQELTKLALGYVTIEKGIEAVGEAYTSWHEEIKAAGEASRDTNKELTKTIILAGQAANAGKIEERLSRIPGVTKREGEQAFYGVYEGAPGEMSVDRRLDLAESSSKIAQFGAGIDTREFGKFVGEVSELAPGRNADRTRDLALAVLQRLGTKYAPGFVGRRQFSTALGLTQIGAFETEEDALGVEVEGARHNPMYGKQLLTALEKHHKAPKTYAERQTPEGKALVALSKANTAAEKLAIIQSDPAAARAAGIEGQELFRMDKAREDAEFFKKSPGLFDRSLAESRSSRGIRESQLAHEDEVHKERVSRGDAEHGKTRDRAFEALELALKEQNTGPIERFKAKTMFQVGLIGSGAALRSDDPQAYAGALGTASQRASQIFLEGQNKIEGYERYDPRSGYLTEEGRGQKGVIEAIEKQTEVIRYSQWEGERRPLMLKPATINNENSQ